MARGRSAIERALHGGRQLTRTELAFALRRAGIAAEGMRLAYLMMHCELNAVICSGARRGNQFTYALLEERVPRARKLDREEALAELTRRYVTSHGPVTARDYSWWSGLTVREANAGFDMIKPALVRREIDGLKYWSVASRPIRPKRLTPASAYLLPNYDEFLIAYKDRGAIVGTKRGADGVVRQPDVFSHHLVIGGRLAGSWRRAVKAGSVSVEIKSYTRLTRDDAKAVAAARERLSRFLTPGLTDA
jgi:hypothetical protein